MNFLTVQVSDRSIRFCGGTLDGQFLSSGEAIFIQGDTVWFGHHIPPIDALECGFWILHGTLFRGNPGVICSYFNKRTQCIEQRYLKIFYNDGIYRCGPRFPRLMERLGKRTKNSSARLKHNRMKHDWRVKNPEKFKKAA